MAPNGLINRTMVHASAAADASKHIGKFSADQIGTAIIEKHEVQMLRAFEVTIPSWPSKKACVV